jgi:hypothetical protein
MAATLAEADAMIAAARRNGVKLMIGHSRRFTRRYREVARLIQEGAVGEVRLVRETDLARWVIGQEAVSVYAAARITDPEGEVPEFRTYLIAFVNGALAAAEIVNQLPAGYPYSRMLEVLGTEGVIRAADPPMSPLEVWRPDGMVSPLNFSHLLHVDGATGRRSLPLPAVCATLASLYSTRGTLVRRLPFRLRSCARASSASQSCWTSWRGASKGREDARDLARPGRPGRPLESLARAVRAAGLGAGLAARAWPAPLGSRCGDLHRPACARACLARCPGWCCIPPAGSPAPPGGR